MRMVVGVKEGESLPIKRPKGDMVALAGCTVEGVNYTLECLECRGRGIRRQYLGETSRSGYQRYLEHLREIKAGQVTHPMVIHFMEEHEGRPQEVLFRLTSKHQTPLDRQVQESVNIEEGAKSPRECLNLKNEWAGSKLPGISIQRPKGVMGGGRNKTPPVDGTATGVPEAVRPDRRLETQPGGEIRGTKRVRLQQEDKEGGGIEGLGERDPDNKGRTDTEPIGAVEGEWVKAPSPKRRCRRETEGKDQRKHVEASTGTETETRGDALSDRQIVENFTQLYWRNRPPSWSPGQDQSLTNSNKKRGQTRTQVRGQGQKTQTRDMKQVGGDRGRPKMTAVGRESGLGPRVSLRDILRGRKRDNTPKRAVLKRLGTTKTKDRTSQVLKGGVDSRKGRQGQGRDTGRASTRDVQATQDTQPVPGELRRSLRLQAGQAGGRKAWCVWCGVRCRQEGAERNCVGRSGGAGKQGEKVHRTLRKVLVPSRKGIIHRERTTGPQKEGIMAPKVGSLRASGHKPSLTGGTSDGKDPQREGGTYVGRQEGRIQQQAPTCPQGGSGEGQRMPQGRQRRAGLGLREQDRERHEGSTAAQRERYREGENQE